MKKKITLIIASVLLLVCIGGVSYAAVQKVAYRAKQENSFALLERAIEAKDNVTARPNSKEEVANRINHIQNKFDLRQYLQSKGYYEDEIQIILKKYIDASVLYDMTAEESDYFISLCELDYDVEKLLDIYRFLKITNNDDINLIKIIYKMGEGDYSSKFWIENAYAKIAGMDDALTMEEMLKYTNSGISIEEIVMVFEMSLQGNKTEREMLDARLNGKSWSQIASEAYNNPEMAEKFTNDTSLDELNTFATKVRIAGGQLTSPVTNDSNSIDSVYTEKTDCVHQLQAQFCDDSAVIAKAKSELPQLQGDMIKELFENGYRIREIKEATSSSPSRDNQRQEAILKLIDDKEKEVTVQ